jgi:hypothetical protein
MSHTLFPWRDAFLAALAEMPVLQHACDAVGINRSTAFRARQDDKDFDAAVREAMEAGIDKAEAEAFRRGVVGFQEPVVHKGSLMYLTRPVVDPETSLVTYELVRDETGQPVPLTVRKHSDQMLALVLQGRRKQVYANRTEITGADGGAVVVDRTARAARLAYLTELAKQRKEAEDFG